MILVTGANGMVGSYIREFFSDTELLLTDLPKTDITDKALIGGLIKDKKPSHVIHLAAATDVDRCETEPEFARRLNVEGTRNVAQACGKYGVVMVYVSTGFVFNGKNKEIFTESDATDPVNVYGRTKLEAEHVVEEILKEYYIFRAEWMIGGGPEKDKKFVGKVIEKCLKGEDVQAVDDMYSTPTFARDFVRSMKALIGRAPYGLYHLSNKGLCSRYELALEIAKDLGAKNSILPVPSSKFPLPAPRAASTGIKSEKLAGLGFDLMPRWQDSLKEYIQEWKDRQNPPSPL